MNKLKDLFGQIKNSFIVRKKISFDDLGISVELCPLSTLEEMKIIEACKDLEGAAYMDALKKHTLAVSIRKINDEELGNDEVSYVGDDGNKVLETKYLFMLHQIESWPGALRDVFFDAFNEMQLELEKNITDKTKFDRFTVQPAAVIEPKAQEAGIPEGFKRVEEPSEPEDDADKLNKRVKEEVEQAQRNIDIRQ